MNAPAQIKLKTLAAVPTAAPQQQVQQQVQQNGQQPPIEIIMPPSRPGEWSIAQIITALSRPLPKSVTATRNQGGKQLTYVSWHQANRILDKYAIGWSWEVRQTVLSHDRIFITGRLTIPTCDGNIWREATGSELLKEEKTVYIPNPNEPGKKIPLLDDLGNVVTELREIAYGDPSSNAESMAFRRVAARFGLGLYLYDK